MSKQLPKGNQKLINDIVLRNLKPMEKTYSLSDGNGLQIVVHSNGSIYFQFRYTFHSQQKKIQIGVYPEVSLSEARNCIQKYKAMLKEGSAPHILKLKEKASGRIYSEATFELVAQEWLGLKSKKVSYSYYLKINGMVKANCFDRLGQLPISDINSPMILQTLKVIEKRGSIDLMHRMRKLLGELFEYAKLQGYFVGENPVHCLRRSVALLDHKKGHYITLKSEADLCIFLKRLNEYSGQPMTKMLIQLQLLTALRPGEMRAAVWSQFDFEAGIRTIPAFEMKMRRDHLVALSKQAIEILQKLKQISGYSKYLFPSFGKDGILSDATVNKALRSLWPEYRIHAHGFRHLFSTFANEAGFNKDLIETALAHGDRDRVRGIYNRANYLEERKKLAQWYSDFIFQKGMKLKY